MLSWYENHSGDDIPPDHIWEDPQGLSKHWEKVKERMDEKYGVSSGPKSSVTETAPMEENALARELRGK